MAVEIVRVFLDEVELGLLCLKMKPGTVTEPVALGVLKSGLKQESANVAVKNGEVNKCS